MPALDIPPREDRPTILPQDKHSLQPTGATRRPQPTSPLRHISFAAGAGDAALNSIGRQAPLRGRGHDSVGEGSSVPGLRRRHGRGLDRLPRAITRQPLVGYQLHNN